MPDTSDPQQRLEEDLALARAVYHPLRFQIFLKLMKSPATVKEVAEVIGETPNKLYYHFKLLEDNGLIRVTGTNLVSGIVEKQYQSVPGRYRLNPMEVDDVGGLGGVHSAVLQEAFKQVRDALQRDQQEPQRSMTDRPLFHWSTVKLSEKKQRELRRKLAAIVGDLSDEDRRGEQGSSVGIMLALYSGEPD